MHSVTVPVARQQQALSALPVPMVAVALPACQRLSQLSQLIALLLALRLATQCLCQWQCLGSGRSIEALVGMGAWVRAADPGNIDDRSRASSDLDSPSSL